MRIAAVGLWLFVLAGPALADAPAATKPQATAPAPPVGVWRGGQDGEYVHVQSGLRCPSVIDDHRRRQVELFDKIGLDVGCDYPGPTSSVTYYLTRRQGGGVPEAMAEAKRELISRNAARHPQLASDTHYLDAGRDWVVATYSTDNELADGIWMTDVGGWTLEYRVTYRAADQSKIADWVKGLAAGAIKDVGPRLDICARAPVADRNGRLNTNEGSVASAAMMISILNGAALTAKPDKAKPEDAPYRCAEQGAVLDGIPMLFWRTIRRDGTDAMTDGVTVETASEPVTMSVSSGVAGLLAALGDKDGKAGADKPAQWSATVDNKGVFLIFGVFEGRPAINDMGDLFAAALKGKIKAVGSYSASGNNITISAPAK